MTAVDPPALSPRENEVLEAVGIYLSNAQIAHRLSVSVRTVESHVSALLRKCGVADRRELAALYLARSGSGPVTGAIAGLPRARTSFVGRAADRAAVLTALTESRVVTLVGPGGVGKTRLAATVVGDVAHSFPYGGAFVDLVPVREGFVAQAIAATLGVAERPQQSLEDVLHERLHGRSLLAVDNCEHLLDTTAAFVERLLSACPEVTVLVTSRERLGVSGERIVMVRPLSVRDDAPDGRSASEAEALFYDRIGSVDPGVDVDPEVVGELCDRLDGMPLAIELAAARASSLGVDGLLAGLEDRMRLLTGGRGGDERHQSLRAVIDWSHDLLDEDERALFRRLGVFVGGFDLAAARAVDPSRDRAEIADLIGRLVDKSLLTRRSGAVGSSWRMLETIRAYASDRLVAGGDDAVTRERHLRWAATSASEIEAGLYGPEWQADFDQIADDLRTALAGTSGAGPDGVAYALARGLGHLAYARRFFTESLGHYGQAAERAPTDSDAAAALRAAADVAMAEARGDLAFDLLLDAAKRARSAGDDAAYATALAYAVTIADRYPAEFPTEVPHVRLSRILAEATRVAPDGDPTVAAYLAAAAAWNGQPRKFAAEPGPAGVALDRARATGDPVLVSGALDAVGAAVFAGGRLREAHEIAKERLELLDRMPRHDPRCGVEIFDTFHMAAESAVVAGSLPDALATAHVIQTDDLLGGQQHQSASKLVIPLVLQGRFPEAFRQADRMWAGWLQIGRPVAGWMAPPVYAAALAHSLRGDEATSELWARRMREVAVDETAGVAAAWRTFVAFADPRIALHAGRVDDALAAAVDLQAEPRPWHERHTGWYDAYAWSVAAEVAVVAGLPDAAAWLAVAEPVGAENGWAAACLARAKGRLYGDVGAFEESVAGWERIGARFERACTLLLIGDRATEGAAELRALGCSTPP